MSITFTNARRISTGNTNVPWDGQPQASYAFLLRFEPGCGTTPGVLNTCYILSRGLNPYYTYTQSNNTPSSLNCRFFVSNATTQVNKQVTFNLGTTYHIAVVYDQGHQTFYVNGIGSQFGTLTGNTKTSGSNPCDFGANVIAGPPFIFTIHDFAMWNGYALTQADVAGLRDGSLLPPDVGVSASWRGRWKMDGTPGATVTLGDTAIANAYGDHTFDLKTFAGTGTSVYSAPLAFEPAALAVARLMTSGKTVGFDFKALSNGATTLPIQVLATPTAKKNGASVGSLVKPFITGTYPTVLFALPDGVSLSSSDTLTVSAPSAWMNTAAGIAQAMTDLAATNCVGRSAYGTDALAKTFRPGTNNAHLAFQNHGVYIPAKNWRLRCDLFSGATLDATGRPISASTTSVAGVFYSLLPQSTVDKTISFPVGLWAVGWDDTLPASPTTLSLTTASNLMLSITPRHEYDNPGTLVGGVQVGIVRVFDVQMLRTTQAAATGFNSVVDLRLNIANASKSFHYTNDVVYSPDEFTPGTPTVLDKSDPYAISDAYLAWLANGVGSLRFIDSLWEFGGYGTASQPEHAFRLTDYTWGLDAGRYRADCFFNQIRPWNPAVTPYIYATLFGSPYNVILASPIDAVTTTLNITVDPANIVVIGLRLKVGSELMRITNVVGSTVTVKRGECGTTAASHAAGTIEVNYRWNAATGIPGGKLFEIVSATPHGYDSGQTMVTRGNWPALTYTDSSTSVSINLYHNPQWVTGPNTILLVVSGTPVPWVTVPAPISLDATCQIQAGWPNGPAIPVEYAAKLCSHFTDCQFHFSLPHATSDSLAWAAWGWVRDNYPTDRKINFEYSNEPWNPFFYQYGMLGALSKWLYGSANKGWEYYVQRETELLTIGRQVWTRAGRDPNLIQGMINRQKNDVSNASLMMEFAKGLGVPVGHVCIADYINYDTTTPFHSSYWQYDDEQAVDLMVVDLWGNPTGYVNVFNAMNNAIDAYNAKYGEHVSLILYEGGPGAAPKGDFTITAPIDASTTSVPISSATWLVPGIPMLCESEWMTIVSIAGNVLAVTRGAYGSTAAAHANAVAIRTAWRERGRDLLYNPLWYFHDQDHFAIEQAARVSTGNRYSMVIGNADSIAYGWYHIQSQRPGYGDGRGGSIDNRLVLKCPGKANTVGPTIDQDMATASVRGQAFLDWMAGISTGPVDPVDPIGVGLAFVPRHPRKAGA